MSREKPKTAPTGSPCGLDIRGRAWKTWWINECASTT